MLKKVLWRDRFLKTGFFFFQEPLNRILSDRENLDMQVGGKGTPGGAMHNNSDDQCQGCLTFTELLLYSRHHAKRCTCRIPFNIPDTPKG